MTRPAKVQRSPTAILTSPYGMGGATAQPAIDDLSDVDAPTPADGDTLVWDAGLGLWVPGTPVAGSAAASLVPGRQGPAGPPGRQGPPGAAGATGATGPSGTGGGGAPGVRGHEGPSGRPGPPGPDASLIVTDVDGSPIGPVRKIVFPGGTVGISDKVATYTPSAGDVADVVGTSPGAGSVYVPGLRGSPDRLPSSPNALDQEFDSALTGTVLGTLDTDNVSDFPSHWHVKRTTATTDVNGRYWAVPSLPFTVTMKIAPNYLAGYPAIGIMLLDSTPTAIREFSYNLANGTTMAFSLRRWTSRTAFSSSVDATIGTAPIVYLRKAPMYIQLLVTSSTSVTMRYSIDGMMFQDISGITAVSPTITPAFFGICLTSPVGNSTIEGAIDWMRVT